VTVHAPGLSCSIAAAAGAIVSWAACANSWTDRATSRLRIHILGVAVPKRITIMGHTTQSFISLR
jgi:hypothetical protein